MKARKRKKRKRRRIRKRNLIRMKNGLIQVIAIVLLSRKKKTRSKVQ